MPKLPISELLRLACMFAEQDRKSFIECYGKSPDDPVAVEAREFVEQLHAYRVKRWGKSRHEVVAENAREVTVDQILSKEPT